MDSYTIALAGNPNVGKSTVFNALTGLHQHTGNWSGKTVENAMGHFMFHMKQFDIIDLPGIYSLRASSEEERTAREYLVTQHPDAVIFVCDACCLERNLNLALQIAELTPNLLLCVNMLDEAKAKQITIDLNALSEQMHCPAVGISARSGDVSPLLEQLDKMFHVKHSPLQIEYPPEIESIIQELTARQNFDNLSVSPRWAALRLLEQDTDMIAALTKSQQTNLQEILSERNLTSEQITDQIISAAIRTAQNVAGCCIKKPHNADSRDRKLDRLFLGKYGGITLLLLLVVILWITMTGANVPSELLSRGLFSLGDYLHQGMQILQAPAWLDSLLIDGVYRTLAWIVSVMLPPMAIFFPLFTLLEDIGYLPRAAFLLDKPLCKAGASGKQALTMCMGLGCNACGVTGCRIIDSPREKRIAMLTNVFMPCNGRFPLMISISTIYLAAGNPLSQSIILTMVILLGLFVTFGTSWGLSRTLYRSSPTAFTLELPPYRKPQLGKILVRSLFDRTLKVLGRACISAVIAGVILWLMANLQIGESSLLRKCADCLNPFAACLGLDGIILLAFLLAFPANEIVIPIILMGYLSQGTLTEFNDISTLHDIFTANGWTIETAVCTMLFSLLHYPCSTTLLTIRRESGSFRFTLLSAILPTLIGIAACALVHLAFTIL